MDPGNGGEFNIVYTILMNMKSDEVLNMQCVQESTVYSNCDVMVTKCLLNLYRIYVVYSCLITAINL